MPEGIDRFTTRSEEYIFISEAKGYLSLAQFGVVELHVWGCHRDNLEKPDLIVFDLDPGDDLPWREVVDAAVHVRGQLERLNLATYVKTSGGKGIHVVVPIEPKLNWKAVHERCAELVQSLADTAPEISLPAWRNASEKAEYLSTYTAMREARQQLLPIR